MAGRYNDWTEIQFIDDHPCDQDESESQIIEVHPCDEKESACPLRHKGVISDIISKTDEKAPPVCPPNLRQK